MAFPEEDGSGDPPLGPESERLVVVVHDVRCKRAEERLSPTGNALRITGLVAALSGCVHLGPMDAPVRVVGAAPSHAACVVGVAALGRRVDAHERPVSAAFRESFVVNPSRGGHRAVLTCDGVVVAERTFRLGLDLRAGEDVVLQTGASSP